MRPNKVEYYRRSGWNPQKRKQPFPAIENNWSGAGWIDYTGGTGGTGGDGTGGDGTGGTGGSGSEHQGGNYDDHPGNWRRKKLNKGYKRATWWQQHKDRMSYAGGTGYPNSYINVPPKAKEASQPPASVHGVFIPLQAADSDMDVEVGTSGGDAIQGSSFPPIPPGMPGIVPPIANPAQGKQYVLTCIT